MLFTDEELKALEAAASQSIDIQEFVPLADVDPVYFEDTHYLGPDKGAEKAYQLLAEAMRETAMVALAQHVERGKEHLVLIRAVRRRASRCTRSTTPTRCAPFDEIDDAARRRPSSRPRSTLARKLIEQLAGDKFAPGAVPGPLAPAAAGGGRSQGRRRGRRGARDRARAAQGDRPHGGAQAEPRARGAPGRATARARGRGGSRRD